MHKVTPCILAIVFLSTAAYAHGDQFTGPSVLAKCRAAYSSVKSYEGNSSVSVTIRRNGKPEELKTTAQIRFVRPIKMRVEGSTVFGGRFGYVSNGIHTWQLAPTGTTWNKVSNLRTVIASSSGTSLLAGTSIPSLLIGNNYGNPLGGSLKAEHSVKLETVGSTNVWRVDLKSAGRLVTVWVDRKTYLLVKLTETTDPNRMRVSAQRKPANVALGNMAYTHTFTDVKTNEPIAVSVFAKP